MPATAKLIHLHGDKRKPESAEHRIVFPGGSIALTRTSDNEYWAHIEVNRKQADPGMGVRETKHGVIVDSRVDQRCVMEILGLPGLDKIEHIAVRIATQAPPPEGVLLNNSPRYPDQATPEQTGKNAQHPAPRP